MSARAPRGGRRTLERVLSRAGLCSRPRARELVRGGRVEVGGRVERDPDRWIDPERESVRVDGRELLRAAPLHVALHKPRGCVTSFGDPEGRTTVYDLLGDVGGWVGPVGRLDRDTSGLLLLTNDTELAERLTSPASRVEKVYRVRTARPFDADALERLRAGVELDDGPARPVRAELVRSYKGYALLDLVLVEGRNRQVRRMLSAVGNRVARLRRTRVGPVELGDLASGAWRPLTAEELRGLRA